MTELMLWELFNEALIAFVVALIGLLAWYVRAWLKEKLSNEQYSFIIWLASMAVQAAEQLGGSSADKKRQAMATAQAWLTQRGIHIELSALDDAIEAAVYEQLTKKQFTDK